MNFEKYLGASVETVRAKLPDHSMEETYDHLEDGDEQEYFLCGIDKSWEIPIPRSGKIETIFLYLSDAFTEYHGISQNMTKEQVVSIFGKPIWSGEPSTHGMLEDKGAWEKYQLENYFLHIEHVKNYEGVKMITLMVIKQSD